MARKKVCAITGSRAEYGLLYWVLLGLRNDPDIELQVCVTGMHLSKKYGSTFQEIENDGFVINKKIDCDLSSDTTSAISKATGQVIVGFGEALDELKPDLVLVVGDRFEIFGAVSAAAISNIPIAHCHGGELTIGAFDDSFRHAITKMSHIHFCASLEYKTRILQLGENPNLVFITGALGIENINKLNLLKRQDLETRINFTFGKKNLIVTYHPVTRERESSGSQIKSLLLALSRIEDTHLIFTMPNADTDNHIIIDEINKFVDSRKNSAIAITSMGNQNYLSALQYVDGVVGNSSSGLIEAPSFKVGTVNLGSRQNGRIRAESIIDCKIDTDEIVEAINHLYSKEFVQKLRQSNNPYDHGNASDKILSIIKELDLQPLTKKHFFDLPTHHHGS